MHSYPPEHMDYVFFIHLSFVSNASFKLIQNLSGLSATLKRLQAENNLAHGPKAHTNSDAREKYT